MPKARSNGIDIEYEISGLEDGRPLLLIHGVGAQLTRWSEPLCEGFARAGFRVIRFDNRDVGLSTHMRDAPLPDFAAILAARARGETPDLAYDLSDLARDAAGLLAALKIDRAHILGVSLGGMIAQMLTIEHPGLVLSLAIMMSHSGNPDLPPSDPDTIQALRAIPPDPVVDHDGFIRHSIALNRALGSPDYPVDAAEIEASATGAARRAYDPAGAARQLAAGRSAPDRRAALQALSVPALVIHGADDRLIPKAGGEDIACNIKGAWLLIVNGMGHDLPTPLVDLFVASVAANAARAAPSAAPATERSSG